MLTKQEIQMAGFELATSAASARLDPIAHIANGKILRKTLLPRANPGS